MSDIHDGANHHGGDQGSALRGGDRGDQVGASSEGQGVWTIKSQESLFYRFISKYEYLIISILYLQIFLIYFKIYIIFIF